MKKPKLEKGLEEIGLSTFFANQVGLAQQQD